MKTVLRTDVEELARLIRKYAKTGDTDLFPAESAMSNKLSIDAFGHDRMAGSFKDLIDSICGIFPIASRNASNDLICEVLELIGIHVIDEREKL